MNSNLNQTVKEFENIMAEVSMLFNKHLRQSLNDSDITPPQLNALISIYRNDKLTMGDLSSKLLLACSTTSGLIDRLEKAGLVERRPDERDRRVIRIVLTDKGLEYVTYILEKRRTKMEKQLEKYSTERQKELLENLRFISDLLNKENT